MWTWVSTVVDLLISADFLLFASLFARRGLVVCLAFDPYPCNAIGLPRNKFYGAGDDGGSVGSGGLSRAAHQEHGYVALGCCQ